MPRLNVYTACLAAICSHGFYTAVRLALALLVLRLTQSAANVGLVMMAYALLPALLSPRIGRAVDRHGVRPILSTSLGLMLVMAAALWLLPHHLVVLAMAAAGVGLGFNGFAISIQKLIGGLPPSASQTTLTAAELRKRNFGTLATASSLSAFSGPLFAGWAVDQLTPAGVFAALALLPVLAGLLSLSWQLAPGAAPAAAPSVTNSAEGRSPLLARELWPLAAAIVMLTVAGDTLAFLTPLIGSAKGLSGAAVGSIVSAFAAGTFLVRLASGVFIAKLPEWTYIVATLFVCAVILLLFAGAATQWSLTLLMLAAGAGLGLAQPMTQALLHQSVSADRVGEALGARLALVGAAQAAGPLVLGSVAQALGTSAALAAVSALLVCSGAYVARAFPRKA